MLAHIYVLSNIEALGFSSPGVIRGDMDRLSGAGRQVGELLDAAVEQPGIDQFEVEIVAPRKLGSAPNFC